MKDNVALVTSAGSEIGAAVALVRRKGAQVRVSELEIKGGKKTVKKIRAKGGETFLSKLR